jgi:hypothetical protein
MSEGATGIFKKRKGEGCYCSLIGRYLMDSEIKFRKFFGVFRDILQSSYFSSNSSL